MRVSKLQDHLYLIDLETGGFRNFVSSYVLKGDKTIVVETGPRSSVENLLNGLKEIGVETEMSRMSPFLTCIWTMQGESERL